MAGIPFINNRGWEAVAVHHLTTKWGMEYEEAAELIKKHGWEKVMQEAEKSNNNNNNNTNR
jgi:dissimilatory sulfite reductase (desulfoviridin) alpha/beta subunit